jgi:peptidoglycan/xylan/chitin deacetylase (PgdA/CDA1 family)
MLEPTASKLCGSEPQVREVLRAVAVPKPGLLGLAKSQTKKLLHRLGAAPLLLRRLCRRASLVITYHKVERRPLGLFGTPALDVESFSHHVEYLARTYEIVPLSVLAEGLRREQIPTGAVSITFDDGYRNNLLLAYPVLRHHRVPATVFITAGLIGTEKWLWPMELAEMCLRFGLPAVRRASGSRMLDALLGAELPKPMRVDAAIEYLLRIGPVRREEILGRLRRYCRVLPDDENRFLSWDEVRALRAGDVEIGSHTMTHPVLTDLEPGEADRELVASREIIEENLGESPTLFCYPHGRFNASVKALAGRYYHCAVSTIAGKNTLATDPMELRRVAAYTVDDLAFQLARPH